MELDFFAKSGVNLGILGYAKDPLGEFEPGAIMLG